nr:hypothetical transcript [Hymenolepis microstoma]
MIETGSGRVKTVTSNHHEGVLKEKLKTSLAKYRRRASRALLLEFRCGTLPNPPYSPNLAPSDFLFSKLKEHL